VESLSASKIIAVVASFLGVVLVTTSDKSLSSSSISPASADPSSPVPSNPLLGDALALVSAIFYAIYVVFLKVKVKNEDRVDMQLMLG
jgi:solute carrier family 35 protein F5